MKRDPLFFEFFKELPGCFFQLVGRSERDAEKYELEAIEYKATAVRLEGVFRPRQPAAGPAYLWEAQY
jgi:predicted transposase YdaD